MYLTVACWTYRQRFSVILEHKPLPFINTIKTLQPLDLVYLYIICVLTTEFTSLGAQFCSETVGFVIFLI